MSLSGGGQVFEATDPTGGGAVAVCGPPTSKAAAFNVCIERSSEDCHGILVGVACPERGWCWFLDCSTGWICTAPDYLNPFDLTNGVSWRVLNSHPVANMQNRDTGLGFDVVFHAEQNALEFETGPTSTQMQVRDNSRPSFDLNQMAQTDVMKLPEKVSPYVRLKYKGDKVRITQCPEKTSQLSRRDLTTEASIIELKFENWVAA